MRKLLRTIRIGFLHATYHRNLKWAQEVRKTGDIIKFKKYIYQAEDAWRKIVILTNKNKPNNG
mgnify:CR=1 FL=1|jgi:hypothetical protein|tara:strand:+ start:1391 stop:1579 length:189 start_codon:yes stop_codon:yes gene_type:complete